MGWINGEKPPEKWSASYFKMFVERLRTAMNYIDSSNFPDGISGLWLKAKSVPVSALTGIEFNQTLVAVPTAYTVASTTLTNVGGYFIWDSMWGSAVSLKLEIIGGSGHSSATATFELHGTAGKLGEVTSNLGTIQWLRSEAITPPTDSQTLLLKVKTSNASYPTNLLTARLIIGIK